MNNKHYMYYFISFQLKQLMFKFAITDTISVHFVSNGNAFPNNIHEYQYDLKMTGNSKQINILNKNISNNSASEIATSTTVQQVNLLLSIFPY